MSSKKNNLHDQETLEEMTRTVSFAPFYSHLDFKITESYYQDLCKKAKRIPGLYVKQFAEISLPLAAYVARFTWFILRLAPILFFWILIGAALADGISPRNPMQLLYLASALIDSLPFFFGDSAMDHLSILISMLAVFTGWELAHRVYPIRVRNLFLEFRHSQIKNDFLSPVTRFEPIISIRKSRVTKEEDDLPIRSPKSVDSAELGVVGHE